MPQPVIQVEPRPATSAHVPGVARRRTSEPDLPARDPRAIRWTGPTRAPRRRARRIGTARVANLLLALASLGRLAGLVATYVMLVTVLLVARLPVVERAIGQDRLLGWHRRLGPWPLGLLVAHGVLITGGYAQQARTGALHELGVLLTTYTGVLAASVGFLLLIAAGVTSYRIARRRMRYETWWSVHLYTYLALGLAFSHQVATGASFVGHPVARAAWTAAWVGAAGLALLSRVLLPLWRTLRHRLEVVSVEREAPGLVSIVCRGRRLDRLPLEGGQFLQWRFLERGLWWQAHPYSPSALIHPPFLRVTVKDLGDHSHALTRLRPGTRIAIEGPYGAFTERHRTSDRVLLAGAGVGVTPLRALLEDLPGHVEVIALVRASTPEDLVMRDELHELIARRGGRLLELLGSREDVRVDGDILRRMVPDLAACDVYICGPDGFARGIVDAARGAGTPAEAIHREDFSF